MKAPNVWTAIEHCYESPDLMLIAQRNFAAAAQELFYAHKVELSASSAGKCVLDVWAYLHDQYTLPENHATELAKMDGGTLYGARIAALFAAGYEDLTSATVAIECAVEHDEIPGHLDITINDNEGRSLWIVEVKTSFSTFAFDGPPEYHKIQAAKYALARNAPGFSVFTLLPAAQKRKGESAMHYAQWDGVTTEWAGRVDAEYARLQKALDDEPPIADPQEAWRCSYCRYGACPKNVRYAPEEILA